MNGPQHSSISLHQRHCRRCWYPSHSLLWEDGASTPTNDSGCGFGEMLTEDLFDDAVQHINGLAIETGRIFLNTSVASGIFQP